MLRPQAIGIIERGGGIERGNLRDLNPARAEGEEVTGDEWDARNDQMVVSFTVL
jgi:hypothetical protein